MAKDLEVAIVFADVVGSTQLYDEFGDTKASETVAVCLDIMKDAIQVRATASSLRTKRERQTSPG